MDPAEPVQTSLRRPRKQEGAHQFYMKQARYEMAHEVAEMKTGWRRNRISRQNSWWNKAMSLVTLGDRSRGKYEFKCTSSHMLGNATMCNEPTGMWTKKSYPPYMYIKIFRVACLLNCLIQPTGNGLLIICVLERRHCQWWVSGNLSLKQADVSFWESWRLKT
jgi:hypothetical protein